MESMNQESIMMLKEQTIRAIDIHQQYKQDFPVKARENIYSSFEEAVDYYRNEPVILLANSLKTAIELEDEEQVVECVNLLYNIFSDEAVDDAQKIEMVNDMELLIKLLGNRNAIGNLYYYLGKISHKLSLIKIGDNYFKEAIELDNEYATNDEDVFWSNYEFIYIWLEKYISDTTKQSKEQAYEQRYNELTRSKEIRPKACYKLAVLHENNETGRQIPYFEECIRLGVDDVVTNEKFLKSEYENDFLVWFENTEHTNGLLSAIQKCLEPLWRKGNCNEFSNSYEKIAHQCYNGGEKNYAYHIYNKCALSDLTWANDFLIRKINDEDVDVINNVKVEVIDKWYQDKNTNEDIYKAIGILIKNGKAPNFAETKKGLLCQCIYYLYSTLKGGVMRALHFFREAYEREKEEDAIMMQFIIEKINLFIKKEYKNLLTGYYKDINALCNIDDNVTRMIFNNSADKRICSENIKKSIDNFLDFNCDDEEYISAYFDGKPMMPSFSIMQEKNDRPKYGRYLVYKVISELTDKACYNANTQDKVLFASTQPCWHELADQELEACIKNYNYFALLSTIIDGLYSKDKRPRSKYVLYALTLAIEPERSPIPFILLNDELERGEMPDKEYISSIIWHLLNRPENFHANSYNNSYDYKRQIWKLVNK